MWGDGDWQDHYDIADPARLVTCASLHLSPVYTAEVSINREAGYWRSILNGREIAASPTIEQAKAKVEWRIANELGQIHDSYRALLKRRHLWADAGGHAQAALRHAEPGRYPIVLPYKNCIVGLGDDVCRDYRRRQAMGDYYAGFSETKLKILSPPRHQARNLEPQEDINPTDTAPIFRLRAEGDGLEMVDSRWWFMPRTQHGSYKDFRRDYRTFNARSDKVASSPFFQESYRKRRCLIPADGWYEWTTPETAWKKKTKWVIEPRAGEWFCIAGIWDRAHASDEGEIETFTMITHAAGAFLQKWHDRAPVVLERKDWDRWLDPAAAVDDLVDGESRDLFKVTYHSGPEPTAALKQWAEK
jgi:putative SOS response-associated peptidase YedK